MIISPIFFYIYQHKKITGIIDIRNKLSKIFHLTKGMFGIIICTKKVNEAKRKRQSLYK